MNIDKKALKSIVDEIEASRARQRGETEHQREVMKRAKEHQLDAKAIRIVLQRRAMGDTKRDEQDYYVHSYETALGGKKDAIEALERGATVREAAAAGNISTGAAGNLAKVVQKPAIVDSEPSTSAGGNASGDAHPAVHCGALVKIEPGCALDAAETERPAPAPVANMVVIGPAGSVGAVAALSPRVATPIDTRTFDEIVGERPSFLSRRADV